MLFSRKDFSPSEDQQILISSKMLLFFHKASGYGQKPALKTLLLDLILWHDEFVVVEACLIFGGRHIIIVLDLSVCRSLVRAGFSILMC